MRPSGLTLSTSPQYSPFHSLLYMSNPKVPLTLHNQQKALGIIARQKCNHLRPFRYGRASVEASIDREIHVAGYWMVLSLLAWERVDSSTLMSTGLAGEALGVITVIVIRLSAPL